MRKQSGIPGYVAWKTFCRFLEKNLKHDQLPRTIDRSLMGGFSGGDQGQILATLRFLRLTDASDKTEGTKLKALLDAQGTNKWPPVLNEVLDTAYADIAPLDAIAGSTPKELIGKFRTKMKEGITVSRAISFYLKAAEEAGTEVPATLKRAPGMAKPPRKKKKTTKTKPGDGVKDQHGADDHDNVIALGLTPPEALHPMIAGLIQSLPAPGSVMAESQRKDFEATFGMALKLAYRVAAKEEESE